MKKFFVMSLLALVSIATLISCSSTKGTGKDMGPLTATVKTNKGDIVIELFGDKAPLTCANFVNLANRGYYDGIIFHRVINDFMAQCGDPKTLNPSLQGSWGTGDPGYKFEDEFDQTLKHDRPGVLSMANSGPNTNGSQLFITHVPTPHLDGKHSVFGKIKEGDVTSVDVLNSIVKGDKIITVEITGKIPAEMIAKQARVDEWNKVLDEQTTKAIPELKLKPATPFK